MNTHVHLNPNKLSILSIPRDKYWLFTSSLLQLLYNESAKSSNNSSRNLSDDENEEDDEEDDEDYVEKIRESSAELDRFREEEDLDDVDTPRSEVQSWPSSINHSTAERYSTHSANSDKQANIRVDNSSKVRLTDYEESFNGNRRFSTEFGQKLGHSRTNSRTQSSSDSEFEYENNDEDNYFFHIAFTPVECTIICSSKLMETYFREPLQVCHQLKLKEVELLEDSFVNLQVDTDGALDSSLSILELTKPLSENNISLFFISSHFNDIVLVPSRFKDKVIHVLTKKNFTFSNIETVDGLYQGILDGSDMSPALGIDIMPIGGTDFSGTSFGTDETGSYGTEVAGSFGTYIPRETFEGVSKFEASTFRLFENSNIKPIINNSAKLLLTGARSGEVNNTILKAARVMTSTTTIPNYFAITRTSINEVSLVLPKSSRKRARMGFDSKNIIGSTQDIIIPVTIDFQRLPLDSTGIVAGVSSRLINGFKKYNQLNEYIFEMNYLSMAKSGIIMVPQENVHIISKILSEKFNDEMAMLSQQLDESV